MNTDYCRFTLRLPDDVMEKMKEIAKNEGRSTTKEIEFALRKFVQSYEAEKD